MSVSDCGCSPKCALAGTIRDFFSRRNFTEVKTCEVVSAPFPEPYNDAVPCGEGYYRTSHELGLKILLSNGASNIYEIGFCRRANENGRYHRERFTMLEWYQVGACYTDLIGFTRDMLIYAAEDTCGSSEVEFSGSAVDISGAWEVMTVKGAFAKFARTSLDEALAAGRYEEILTGEVEPELARLAVPVVLKDFPAEFAGLSELCDYDNSFCRRWELYLGGVEIANAYTELTDEEEHWRRFAKFAEIRRLNGAPEYPVNEEFMSAVSRGIPSSAGCSLGLDRLQMIYAGASRI